MKQLFFFVPLLLFGYIAYCQKLIETDRPSQGESPSIVPKYWLQLESGNQRNKLDDDQISWLAPTLLTRFGLSEKLELRLLTEIHRIARVDPVYSGHRFFLPPPHHKGEVIIAANQLLSLFNHRPGQIFNIQYSIS